MLLQILPRIPLRADELAGDAVALGAGEINGEAGTEVERGRALFLPLLVLLEEGCADFLGTGGEHFINEPRGQRAGSDGVHVHVERAQLLGERFHQAHHGGLARGVGADVGHRISRAAAGDDDDLAGVVLFEMRDERARGEQKAEEIDVQRAPPLVEVHALGRPHRAVDAGVRDECVNGAELAERVIHDVVNLRLVRHVADVGDNFLAGRRLGEFLLRGGQLGLAARAEQDVRARAHVMFGDGLAQPLAGPGDDGVASLKLFHFLDQSGNAVFGKARI